MPCNHKWFYEGEPRQAIIELQLYVREDIIQGHIGETSDRRDTRVVQIGLVELVNEILATAISTDLCEVGVIEISAAFELCEWLEGGGWLFRKCGIPCPGEPDGPLD